MDRNLARGARGVLGLLAFVAGIRASGEVAVGALLLAAAWAAVLLALDRPATRPAGATAERLPGRHGNGWARPGGPAARHRRCADRVQRQPAALPDRRAAVRPYVRCD